MTYKYRSEKYVHVTTYANLQCTVLISQTSTWRQNVRTCERGWEEETASVYIAELLNRFIGNRVSNVAISPAWPWTRKLNDQSINSLIPAVRTPPSPCAGRFLRLCSPSVCTVRAVALALPHQKQSREEQRCKSTLPRSTGRNSFRDKERKLELIPRRKKPLDIFIIVPWQPSVLRLPSARETVMARNTTGYRFARLRAVNFPFRHKVCEQTLGADSRWASGENLRDNTIGSIAKMGTKQEYRREIAGEACRTS